MEAPQVFHGFPRENFSENSQASAQIRAYLAAQIYQYYHPADPTLNPLGPGKRNEPCPIQATLPPHSAPTQAPIQHYPRTSPSA